MEIDPEKASTSSLEPSGNEKATLKDTEPCLICGAPTLERHFQVITCNACAAFFRRSIKLRSSYRCQRSSGNCTLNVRKVGRPLCRYCRLKKCFEVGMKNEGSVKLPKIKPPSSELSETLTKISTQEKINTCPRKPGASQNQQTSTINMEKVYEDIKAILEETPKTFTSEDTFNITKKLVKDLNEFIVKPKNELTNLTKNPDYEKRRIWFESFLIKVAKLLMGIEYFAALPFSDKFLLYKHFWQIFQIFYNCYTSYQHYGANPDDTHYLVNDAQFINIDESEKNLSNTQTETTVFLSPIFMKTKMILKHIKIIKLTLFEFAYVSMLILWSSIEIEDLASETHRLADEMMSKASNELHDHYVNEMNMKNYAARQAELIKLLKLLEFAIREKQQLIAANEIFSFIDHIQLKRNILT